MIDVSSLTREALAEVAASANLAALDEVRVRWLGKKGVLTEQLKSLKDVPAAEKAAYVEKYHKQMADLKKSFEEVEVAVKADKPDDAKKVFEKLSEQKEKGHKDFGADDDK